VADPVVIIDVRVTAWCFVTANEQRDKDLVCATKGGRDSSALPNAWGRWRVDAGQRNVCQSCLNAQH